MKKGIVVGIAGVVGAILLAFVYLACRSVGLDSEGRQYVDAAIPAIVSQWDVTELEERAYAVRASDHANLKALFRRYSKLGKLKRYYGAQGKATMSVRNGISTMITGSYTASADFEAGPAEISLTLIKVDNRWRISWISIDSDVFFK